MYRAARQDMFLAPFRWAFSPYPQHWHAKAAPERRVARLPHRLQWRDENAPDRGFTRIPCRAPLERTMSCPLPNGQEWSRRFHALLARTVARIPVRVSKATKGSGNCAAHRIRAVVASWRYARTCRASRSFMALTLSGRPARCSPVRVSRPRRRASVSRPTGAQKVPRTLPARSRATATRRCPVTFRSTPMTVRQARAGGTAVGTRTATCRNSSPCLWTSSPWGAPDAPTLRSALALPVIRRRMTSRGARLTSAQYWLPRVDSRSDRGMLSRRAGSPAQCGTRPLPPSGRRELGPESESLSKVEIDKRVEVKGTSGSVLLRLLRAEVEAAPPRAGHKREQMPHLARVRALHLERVCGVAHPGSPTAEHVHCAFDVPANGLGRDIPRGSYVVAGCPQMPAPADSAELRAHRAQVSGGRPFQLPDCSCNR